MSADQIERRAAALSFARERLGANLASRDAQGQFDADGWAACAQFGIQALAAPGRYHAHGDVDFVTAMLTMEAFGQGCADNALAFGLNAQMWTIEHPIAMAGTEDQRARYLPGLCDGSLIGAHAMTEADTGSDAFSLQTAAQRVADGYVINGAKRYVTLAPLANVFLTFASTDPQRGKWGVTAFLVDAAAAGVRVSPVRDKMGMRGVPMADVEFTDCFVPESHRLGPEGAGVSLSSRFLEFERCCILASQVGAMARQLDECVGYARKRRQFGKPIGSFQSVSNRIADMKLRLETSRLLLYHCAWLKARGKSALMESSLLKLHVSEAFTASSLDAVRIHGARGYLTEYGIERDLRDAVGGTIYAGTSDIQRNIVAGLLGIRQD